MKKNKVMKIMLIPPQLLPIPAVGGGGIETLITNLIDVNEVEQKAFFIIPSKYDETAQKHNYSHSKIYYFKDGKSVDGLEKKFGYKISCKLSCLRALFRKCLFNRLTYPLFKKASIPFPNDFLQKCLYICKKEKVDFVVNESCLIDTKYFYDISRYVGKKNIYFRIHNSVPVGKKEERTIIPNSIALSDYGRRMWVSDYKIKGDNQVVYCGIDLSLFTKKASDSELDILRNKYGIKKEDKVILYCGRIDEIKGVRQLLEAFEDIDDDNIKLLMVGGVAYSQGYTSPFFDEMMGIIKNDPRIIYVGFIPNKDLYLYYQLATVQVIPTMCEEAAGLVAIEGMASGLPLLVTKSGGLVEYVDDKCAVIIPRDNCVSTNIKKQLMLLLKDKEKIDCMKNNSLIRSFSFSREKYYANFLGVFKHMK